MANTNTKVGNLVDRTGAQGSSSNGSSVWSLIVNQLDPAFLDALNLPSANQARARGLNFTQAMERLVGWFPNRQNRMRRFLIEFQKTYFNELRPGVAAFLAQIIKNFVIKKPLGTRFKLGSFLDYVLSELAIDLKKRKDHLKESFGAALGQIALLLPESYEDFVLGIQEEEEEVVEFEEEDENNEGEEQEQVLSKSWRQPRFLEEHLFYLVNPYEISSNLFVTFASRSRDGPLNFQDSSRVHCLSAKRILYHFRMFVYSLRQDRGNNLQLGRCEI